MIIYGFVGNDIIADYQMVELTTTNAPLGETDAIADDDTQSTSPVDNEVVITSSRHAHHDDREAVD